jgi:transcriptional regulator NrdR family protein
MDYSVTYRVEASDGRLQPFNNSKLVHSLARCLTHRPAGSYEATAIADTVIQQLQTLKKPVWTHSELKHACLSALAAFDQIGAQLYTVLH